MPLPRHTSALGAAKAAVCAEAQGKGDEMADRLFEVEDLGPQSLRRIAVELGLDAKAFDACVASAGTADRIQRESKLLRDAGFQGLPTTYVGARQIVGAQGEEVFREAFDAAARGDAGAGVSGSMFAAIIAVVVGGVAFLGRADHEEPVPAKREPARRKDDEDDLDEDADDEAPTDENDDEDDGDDDESDREDDARGRDDSGSSDSGSSDSGSSDSGSSSND